MADSFVPLVLPRTPANTGTGTGFTPASVPHTKGSAAGATNPREASPQSPVSLSSLVHGPQPGAPAKPQISVTREGDRITQIRVQCNCGQCIEIQCVYS
jgi:hypothetical protein